MMSNPGIAKEKEIKYKTSQLGKYLEINTKTQI